MNRYVYMYQPVLSVTKSPTWHAGWLASDGAAFLFAVVPVN
eukprot:COSAG01_NODE_512_length_16051_cov_33.887161_15_plen_41_part_00